jgi:epoxyqueuosine reductase
MPLPSLAQRLREHARSIGFDRIGITTAAPPEDFRRYLSWTERGYAADLWYLTEANRVAKRKDLSTLLPGAQSVIAGAISYAPDRKDHPSDAKFARYAWGLDYHRVVKDRLDRLAEWLSKQVGPFRFISYVDTGPILERSLAQRAGVGWIGKNTCLIHETIGSYFVLGELVTTLDLPSDVPAVSRCGTCTRCLEACPTKALSAPYELDARRCISYHTIESRAPALPAEIASKKDGWVAGCDICQEVCPWNQKAPPSALAEFRPLPHTNLSRDAILRLDEPTHLVLFGETALERITLGRLKRNSSCGSH